MSKNTTPAATIAPEDLPTAGKDTGAVTSTAEQPCVGCAEKAGSCADCADAAPAETITPTPSAGGRYMRAEDGTLTPIED